MKLSKLFLVSVILFLIIFLNQKVFGENWIFMGESKEGKKYFFNKESITNVSPSVKRVWEKLIVLPEVKLKEREEMGRSLTGYFDYSHTLYFLEINCKDKTFGLLSVIEYDKKGSVIESAKYNNPPTDFISPGSTGETLYKIVCP